MILTLIPNKETKSLWRDEKNRFGSVHIIMAFVTGFKGTALQRQNPYKTLYDFNTH